MAVGDFLRGKRERSQAERREHALGCMLGQLCGDALGAYVEFNQSAYLRRVFPNGVRHMIAGGTFATRSAGQITDDSEMALALARCLAEDQEYHPDDVRFAYISWLNSDPFDVGLTTRAGLQGVPLSDSQANGALMRISPLGIFGSRFSTDQVMEWARQDARLTHVHPVCVESNALFVAALSACIRYELNATDMLRLFSTLAESSKVPKALQEAVTTAAHDAPPVLDGVDQGWVLLAFHNALWQLVHTPNFEEGLVATIQCGGDTDTNAAICGALLGALYGETQIPKNWVTAVIEFAADVNNPKVQLARPRTYWATDARQLVDKLLG